MGFCGVCGASSIVKDGLSEVYEIIDVASGVHFFRCRKDLAVGLLEREVTLA